jgi:hypothetical protein
MDLQTVRQRWVDYNNNLINKYAENFKLSPQTLERLKVFGTEYLIDFESELDEDPDNLDGGILTIDTVTSHYIDSFMGRWLIQKRGVTESELLEYMQELSSFYSYLKENKLYKERAAQYTKLSDRLKNTKKYMKRLKEYEKIQQETDEETKLDLLQEWEFEDII